jgi:protein-S-isoprenylcysteine O-methyltransferase Ste14
MIDVGRACQRQPGTSAFAKLGEKIFRMRLYVGLAFALVGMEVLAPNPFMQSPYVASQILGLVGVVLGLALRAWGSGCAGGHTRSGKIEGVTGGPFAHVRNPIYAGTIVLGSGMSALIGDPLAYGLTGMAFAVLYMGIIPAEEEHLARSFGAEYIRYCSAVPRLIPRWRPWPERSAVVFRWEAARGEWVIALTVAGIYAVLHFEEYLDRIFPWA